MKYLLDTHALIWYLDDNHLLSKKVKSMLCDPKNTFIVSIVSIWEIAIKLNSKKMSINYDVDGLFILIYKSKFEILPINREHLVFYQNLDLIHKDPFDRLLISTAIAENLTLITSDDKIHAYDVEWVW